MYLLKSIPTYKKDNRKPLQYLYESYFNLKNRGWILEDIFVQKDRIRNDEFFLPIISLRTKNKGKALWIISGIHGEEPAGPNAISKNIKFINKLKKKIPIVIFPLCNPKGYRRNWRYPERKVASRNHKLNKSVGSSVHLLPQSKNSKKPVRKIPDTKEAGAITEKVIKLLKYYPPLLTIDLHEDESRTRPYIYSQGKFGRYDPIAKEIIKILLRNKMPLKLEGRTRFNQSIKEGIVDEVSDGSIDELLAKERIIVNNRILKKPSAKTVIVVETTVHNIPLKKRVKVHSKIIKSIPKFWNMAKKDYKQYF